eukprot:s135_g3.t3
MTSSSDNVSQDNATATSVLFERNVLLEVFAALGLPSERATSIADHGCRLRIEVRCNAQGHVTYLDLSDLELNGRISEKLGQLSALEEIHLDHNFLRGSIPSQLGELGSLRMLSLDNNYLTGEIPRALGQLTSLRWLLLWHNLLSGEIPAELGQLKSLSRLYLQHNYLEGQIPKELGRLQALEQLHMFHNQLEGEIPKEIGQLEALQELRLSDNKLSGEIPAEVGNLQKLEILSLSSNKLTGHIPIELGELKSLQRLKLDHNFLMAVPRQIGKLQALKVMHLQTNTLQGEIFDEFGQLQALEVLALHGNKLQGQIPSQIGQMSSLKFLSIFNNQLEGEIPKEIGQLEALQELRLSDNKLSGEIPAEVGNLRRLKILSLSKNQLTGNIPIELGELKSLKQLSLQSNNLTGEIPKELGQLSLLQELLLTRNRLRGHIPRHLGGLRSLQLLEADKNHLEGTIPTELGSLKALTRLKLDQNRLSGPIPAELGQLPSVTMISFEENRLTGGIPGELGELKLLRGLYLRENQLCGKIPPELAKLGEHGQLHDLYLSQNQLSGAIPQELGNLQQLRELSLRSNNFTGSIPKSLGKLENLKELYIDHNQLTGEIPLELGDLPQLQSLYLDHNQLQGSIPAALMKLKRLTRLSLGENRLTGTLPSFLPLASLLELSLQRNRLHGPFLAVPKRLQTLDLGHNSLSGQVADDLPTSLERLDLSHNRFSGQLADIVKSWCNESPVGGSLRELRLSHNRFTGEMPECLLNFSSLKHLSLNNNALQGTVPALPAESKLVVLALHRNGFTGIRCNAIRNTLEGTPCEVLRYSLGLEEVEAILQNCPDTCGTCVQQSSRATFHHNRFSCGVPESISTVDTKATAVMGNMLGHGQALKAPWIATEENQAFLYYSPKIWSANVSILGTISFLVSWWEDDQVLAALILHRPLHRRLHEASRSMAAAADASKVAAANLALLKIAAGTTLLAGPLLIFFVLGTGYYSCSPPLSQMTMANLQEVHWTQLGVVLAAGLWNGRTERSAEPAPWVAWCLMTLLFRSVLPSMPKNTSTGGSGGIMRRSLKEQLRKILAWLCWCVMVATLSLPSILFAVAQALPAKNTSGLSQKVLSFIHRMAPFLMVLIDMVLTGPLCTKYSGRSGIKADRLLMTFRLASAWLLSLLTTIFLHENCLGVWKYFWMVCKEHAPEHQNFNWQIWGEEILNTKRDMCNFSDSWWMDGRCSRAIVDGLAPLLLKKLLLRSTLQPLVLLLVWRMGQPETDPASEEGRHLKLWGRGPKITGSLVPLQQMALLTTYLETLFFWSPLIPLLSLAILGAAAANLFLFDVGVWNFNVRVPSDAMNHSAELSRSYLKLALGASCCFQLWHAFSAKMFGRYVLLVVYVILLSPWASRILPLARARRWFWSDLDRASENEFIQMAIELELMG